MLFTTEGKQIENGVIHREEYDHWRATLTDAEFAQVIQHIHALIDKGAKNRYFRSSFSAGSVWMGTPLEPLYQKAGNGSEMLAGLFFGILVWQVMVEERTENWIFWPAHPEDPVRSVTYFLPA